VVKRNAPIPTKPQKPNKRASAAGAPATAAEILTAQAWAEADTALAEALIAEFRMTAAITALGSKLRRSKNASLMEVGEAVDAEALALAQCLRRAAKVRGFVLFGDPGEVLAYDRERHCLARGDRASGDPVRVTAPGVALGRTVIAQAEVRPVRTRNGRPAKTSPQKPQARQASAPRPSVRKQPDRPPPP
jgi:hypothetical protein